MDNKRIITNLEALLDGYLISTGESIENNIIINDREIVRTLQSVIEKLNNDYDESTTTELKTTVTKNDISEIELNHYKTKVSALGIHKMGNSQILRARTKFKRAYEDWSDEEDGILKELIFRGLSPKQIGEILQRNKGSIESRIRKHKTVLFNKSQFLDENDSFIKKNDNVDNTESEVFVLDDSYSKQYNSEKSINNDHLSNELIICSYCNEPFPMERKKLGYSYCVKCSSEKQKTFVDKGFQTREGHEIMRKRYPM